MELIAKAFIEAQKEMGNAVKDSKNPFFKSDYADLNSVREACIPSLNKHNIAVIQPICHIENKNYVKTILLHESGETIESFTEIVYSKQNDAQAQGSGITYARRYGLQSLVCIGAEDDDGNKASEKPKDQKKNQFAAIAAAADEDMSDVIYNYLFRELGKCNTVLDLDNFKEKDKKSFSKLKKVDPGCYEKLIDECVSKKHFLSENELAESGTYGV